VQAGHLFALLLTAFLLLERLLLPALLIEQDTTGPYSFHQLPQFAGIEPEAVVAAAVHHHAAALAVQAAVCQFAAAGVGQGCWSLLSAGFAAGGGGAMR
jgi:hypothetical protein